MSSYKIKYDSFMSRKMKNNLQEILKQNDGCVAYLYGYQSWCPLLITCLGHLLTLFLSGTCFFDSSPINHVFRHNNNSALVFVWFFFSFCLFVLFFFSFVAVFFFILVKGGGCLELSNGHNSKQRLNVEYDVFSSV